MPAVFANQRAVPLRARNDLLVETANYLGETCFVIKDPTKLQYHRLPPPQYAVLQLLDGERSLQEIQIKFQQQFPNESKSEFHLQHAVLDLYQKGLAWSTRPGQAVSINDRRLDQRWQKIKQTMTNLFFIKLPGFDPSAMLSVSYGIAKWIFHPAFLIGAVAVIVYMWIFMAVHTTELAQRLPTLNSLMNWENTVMLWLVLGATKIIHEFGHAFACRHANGECHEIGVAFLLFSPCLYCDVSDSWLIPNKWKRIGIGLGGVYVELLLASIAFFMWWNSAAGQFAHVCFFVFVVSSISSLLFNLNPLLRLDGYYILSDWLEIPNLRQRSDKALENFCLKIFCGISVDAEPLPARVQLMFIMYSIAATIYRSLLMLVICGFLYWALKPLRMEYFGLIAGLAVTSLGVYGWGKRFRLAIKNHRQPIANGARRGLVGGGVALTAIVGMLLIPLPIALRAPLVLELADAQPIYATLDGTLDAIRVQPGQSVRTGEVLLEIGNPEKASRLAELMVNRNVMAVELKKHQALGDALNISLTRESLQSLDAEIADYQQQLQRMVVRSPCDGTIVAPRWETETHRSRRTLQQWHGTPLQPVNHHCRIDPGTHLLSVAPNRRFQATLAISQFDYHALRVGQRVRLKLNHLPQQTLQGMISRVAPAATESDSSSSLSNLGQPSTDSSSMPQTAARYQAIVTIEGDAALLISGIQGNAKVAIDSQTAAQWIWRNVNSTFNFKM